MNRGHLVEEQNQALYQPEICLTRWFKAVNVQTYLLQFVKIGLYTLNDRFEAPGTWKWGDMFDLDRCLHNHDDKKRQNLCITLIKNMDQFAVVDDKDNIHPHLLEKSLSTNSILVLLTPDCCKGVSSRSRTNNPQMLTSDHPYGQ
ncbi:hypothetical protein RF11_08478 [Thelohanellus kitauei]|uniref:Uncharacterized protein n=1 Tax=Thelohanellus kitauei TaxID=669202 RepID=A0A0C2MUP8_THEKT|nr:hypothetical protein RF11_08478 [Thelohanellus kitauei]